MNQAFDLEPQEWATLRRLLDEALDLPPAQRTAWLENLDPAFAAYSPRLASLLANADRPTAQAVLNTLPKVETAQFAPLPGAAGATPAGRLGPYRLVRELGSGGMASVRLAERTDMLQGRQVALKLPHGGWRRAGLAERLQREREILATLEHPHIARLYDAGVAEDGQPYLALEYVPGEPIDAHCRRLQLGVNDRLRIFLQVLAAAAHAHAHLVVHRDLKPSNILVTEDGQVKLLDFGIAKLLDQGLADETALTQQAGRAFTPEYAAPEQIQGLPLTTVADVYALGVVLFELLADQRPYTLKRDSRAALEEAILNTEVPRPSRLAPADRRRALRGDLDTIVLKALHRQPERRYRTVDALADDIQRFLRHEPVLAQPDSVAYRWRKFIARHRVAVVSAGLALAGIVVGAGVALVQTFEARDQAAQARQAAADAEGARAFLQDMIDAAVPERAKGHEVTVREMMDKAAAALASSPPDDAVLRARMKGVIGYTYHRLGRTEQGRVLVEQAVAEERALGPRGRDLLVTGLMQLGEMQHRQDQGAAAEATLREALAIFQSLGKPANRTHDLLMNQLGLALRSRAPEEALALFKQQHASLQARLGRTHADTVSALANVGSQQIRLRDYAAARVTLEEALPLVKQQLGLRHPAVGAVLNNLAMAESRLGHLTRAIELQREDLELTTQVLGPTHPELGPTWINLAQLILRAGDFAQALEAADRAKAVLMPSRGPQHGLTLQALNTRANVLSALRRDDEATHQIEEAIQAAGDSPPARRAVAALRLSWIEQARRAGRFAQAAERAQALMRDPAALEDRQVLASAHWQAACALVVMGKVAQAQALAASGAQVRQSDRTARPWAADVDKAQWAACNRRYEEAAQSLRAALATGLADRSVLTSPDFSALRQDETLAALRPLMPTGP